MNLKQIAKQVSLLNRLIELLRMQEEPTVESLLSFDWLPAKAFPGTVWAKRYGFSVDGSRSRTPQEAFADEVTQKAWSDELVKVARDYHENYGTKTWRRDEKAYWPYTTIDRAVGALLSCSFGSLGHGWVSANLEGILNKYGRSLIK